MKIGFALICVVAPIAGFSQTLSGATTANNGTGGVFMDLTAGSQNLSVLSFDSFMGAAAGGAFSVEVWTRPGTYVGFSASNVGWTLLDTASGTSVNTTTLANFALNNVISLTAGQTTGV